MKTLIIIDFNELKVPVHCSVPHVGGGGRLQMNGFPSIDYYHKVCCLNQVKTLENF